MAGSSQGERGIADCCRNLVVEAMLFLETENKAASSAEDIAGPLCTLLLLATKDSLARASSICTSTATTILSPLLQYISSSQEPTSVAGTLGLLLHHVVFQQGLLPAAMAALPVSRTQQQSCQQQITLLQLLADELENPVDNRCPSDHFCVGQRACQDAAVSGHRRGA